MLQANLERLKSNLMLMLSALACAKANTDKAKNDSQVAAERSLIESLLGAQRHAAQRYDELVASFEKLNTHVSAFNPARDEDLTCLQSLNMTNILAPTTAATDGPVRVSLESCVFALAQLARSLKVASQTWVLSQTVECAAVSGSYASLGSRIKDLGRTYTNFNGSRSSSQFSQPSVSPTAPTSAPPLGHAAAVVDLPSTSMYAFDISGAPAHMLEPWPSTHGVGVPQARLDVPDDEQIQWTDTVSLGVLPDDIPLPIRQVIANMKRAELLRSLARFKSDRFDLKRKEDYPLGMPQDVRDALATLNPSQAAAIEARLIAWPPQQRKAYIPLNELAPRIMIPSNGGGIYASYDPFNTATKLTPYSPNGHGSLQHVYPYTSEPDYSGPPPRTGKDYAADMDIEAKHDTRGPSVDLLSQRNPSGKTNRDSLQHPPTRDSTLPSNQPHWTTPAVHDTNNRGPSAPILSAPESFDGPRLTPNTPDVHKSSEPRESVDGIRYSRHGRVSWATVGSRPQKRPRSVSPPPNDTHRDKRKRRRDDREILSALGSQCSIAESQQAPGTVDELLRRWTTIAV